MERRAISLLVDGHPDRPALDTALSRAVLARVSTGALPETIRLHHTAPIVAFGRRDVVTPGYPAAVLAAREGGFEAVERLAGGRAAVFHEGTLAFAWAIPDRSPAGGIRARFEAISAILLATFRRLGVDARIGEVAGEYCPGEYSINARGLSKVMGTGQRLVSGAAHVGGVVVVEGGERIRDVLTPVYRSLGLSWDPDTSGDLAAEVPGLTVDTVQRAIIEEFGRRYRLVPGTLDDETQRLAEQFEDEHLAP